MNNVYITSLEIGACSCSTICFKHDGIVGIALYFSVKFCRGPRRRLFKIELKLTQVLNVGQI